MLVFHTPPEPLNKDVVERPTFPIHTDLHAGGFQSLGILRAGEVTPLVAVPDLGGRHGQRTVDRIQDKGQGIRFTFVLLSPSRFGGLSTYSCRPIQHVDVSAEYFS